MRNCIICNSQDREELFIFAMCIDKTLHLPSEYKVCCCKVCGTCYLDSSATLQDYENYYSQCNDYAGSPKNYDKKAKVLKTIISNTKKYYAKEDFIANIGVGQGVLEKLLYSEGYKNILGIDPSLESIIELQKYGIRGIQKSIYNLSDVEKQDFCFLIDTLEHLYDPQLAIYALKNLLNNHGRVFVSVPDYGNLYEDQSPRANNFNCEHINYFTTHSIKMLFEKAGFKEIYLESVPSKTIYGTIYSIWGIFQLDSEINNQTKEDTLARKSILTYQKCKIEEMNAINSRLASLVERNSKCILWGCGNYAMQLWSDTNLKNCNIQFCVDNNPKKVGRTINGKNVYSADLVNNKIEDNMTILICSMLNGTDIEKQIRDMGINASVIVL